MVIITEFELGEIVYLKTDRDQLKRMISGATVRPGGVLYHISCGPSESSHYFVEISKDIDYSI